MIPTASNRNLQAQKGLFLIDRPSSGLNLKAELKLESWEDLLRNDWSPETGRRLLKQVRLPVTEAPQLLRLLNVVGIHRAALFPGYDSVAISQQERWYWDKEWDVSA